MDMPVGRPFGPFEHEGETALFVKRASGVATTPPLAAIAGTIQRELLREKLDARELKLFEERSDREALRVHFDFSEYGIPNPFQPR
jgi:ApbE superfamily uncharacterized protein (UPF0280 family)